MKRFMLCLSVLVLVLAVSVSAFDGHRKGFVLGGGLGFGPVAKISLDGANPDIDKSGLALNFVIGYAPNERDMVVFLRDAVIWSETVTNGFLSKKFSYATGFSGVAWYHYFGPLGKSAYITGGLGVQDWTALTSGDTSADAGFGMLVGGGYEFTRHVQLHGSLSFGKTSFLGVDFNHTQLLITVSTMAF